MKMRLKKFSLYPKLYQRLKLKVQREYKFQCSLDPNEVPSISAKWCLDEKFDPAVNEDIFNAYCSFSQIASAKSRSVRGASHQPAFMVGCLTIGHMCLPCLPSSR